MDISVSVLITTIGRVSLINMLESLRCQLGKNDYLYVIVDGKEYFEKAKSIIDSFIGYVCNFEVIYEEENLGNWGHSKRNKHQTRLKGDYILHGDDDDIYLEGAIDTVKKYVSESDNQTILFFKFIHDIKNKIYWNYPEVAKHNIGSPNGAIPNIPEKMGTWGYRYIGDFDFYNTCKFKHEFIDELIYCAKPNASRLNCKRNLEGGK